jgi:elongation factor G
VLSVTLEPRSRADADALDRALDRLTASDPTLVRSVDPESGATVLAGMGELHLEIAAKRLADQGLQVRVGRPEVAWRETLARAVDLDHRLVQQNGGAGLYAHVVMRLEPAARGAGFTFVDATRGGVIPREWVRAVEAGVRAGLDRGGPTGHPLVDVRATLVDGGTHVKDSSAIAFELAGRAVVAEAARRAGGVLLEPVARARLVGPSEHVGTLIGDVESRRGRVLAVDLTGPGLAGSTATIEAEVPLAATFGWVVDVRSRTQGRGSVAVEPGGYAVAPARVAERHLAPVA